MHTIPSAHELYLYILLKKQLGINRQTALIRVNEVLESDGLAPADFGAVSARELVEAFPHFIKVTVFKKGVVFVTILENAAFEQALAAPAKGDKNNRTSSNSKPWKYKRGAKHVVPVKPKHLIQAVDSQEPKDSLKTKNPKTENITVENVKTEDVKTQVRTQDADDQKSGDMFISELIDAVKEAVTQESQSTLGFSDKPDSQHTQRAQSATEKQHAPEQPHLEAAPCEPSISLTITYDPSGSGAQLQTNPKSVSNTETNIAPNCLPKDFENEVHIDNDLMGILYQIAPMDANVFQLLTEDFLLASASHNISIAGGNIAFPMRYKLPHQSNPITATLKRTPRAQRPWKLAAINVSPSDLATLTVDPFRGLPRAGISPWEKLPSQKGHLALDPLRLLTSERPVADWKLLVQEVSSHIALETDDFASRSLPLQQATIATAYAYRKAHQQLTSTSEDFYLPVRHTPASETICFDPKRPWASSSFFEAIIREKNLNVSTLFEGARTAGTAGYRVMVELYNPSLNVIYRALPVQEVRAHTADNTDERVLVFATPQSDQEPYVAVALLSIPETYALARIFSAGLPNWLTVETSSAPDC
ncbi:hypothetical protein IV60_GL001477 [Lancefieldella rimae]|uniref:Uncharacterized protein n=2 Tax=Lancefieldella rimae TaxID=1383 RepID=B9CNB3_LANR4|nr:hypothetical protein [Lancefieldella rimae]EEE17061.1 hypothetical protein ATORI0001_1072 [Lancefieldella rimae ATCC 49626]KRO01605.1 hypothetical protein IV60_GL001477 [Lancefieldella rimae]